MRRSILVGIVLALAAPNTRAQDASATLQKISAAYGALKSYAHRASTTQIVHSTRGNATGGAANELRFARPDRMYVSIVSPTVGQVVVANDGKQFIGYRSLTNTYRVQPAPRTLLQLDATARAAGVTNMMDPMFFLLGKKASLEGLVAAGKASVNGVPCTVVRGTYRAGKIPWTVTLYADASSHLLRKVSLAAKGIPQTITVNAQAGGRTVPTSRVVPVDISIVTVIQQMTVNQPLPDTDFRFTPPKGAVQQKP